MSMFPVVVPATDIDDLKTEGNALYAGTMEPKETRLYHFESDGNGFPLKSKTTHFLEALTLPSSETGMICEHLIQ